MKRLVSLLKSSFLSNWKFWAYVIAPAFLTLTPRDLLDVESVRAIAILLWGRCLFLEADILKQDLRLGREQKLQATIDAQAEDLKHLVAIIGRYKQALGQVEDQLEVEIKLPWQHKTPRLPIPPPNSNPKRGI